MMRYERSQRTDDLDESIALIREAAAITEAEDPGRESVLTNLAGALAWAIHGDRQVGLVGGV
jgi:hypothetical protein